MIDAVERQKMLRAHSIGPRMLEWLQEIGIERLADLKGADAGEIAMRINIALGHRRLNCMGVSALRSLIELADKE